jgi:hypothetical protein
MSYGKRKFADVIKLRIFKEGIIMDYLDKHREEDRHVGVRDTSEDAMLLALKREEGAMPNERVV